MERSDMIHDDQQLQERAQRAGSVLQGEGLCLAVAESCTGGLLSKIITDCAGASAWFDCGIIVYSNTAKRDLLGVSESAIAEHGAVSQAVAEGLALGLLARAPVTHGVAITGIAGPEGGSAEKPVGTVWLAWATPEGVAAERHLLAGGRDAVRRASAAMALEGLCSRVGGHDG